MSRLEVAEKQIRKLEAEERDLIAWMRDDAKVMAEAKDRLESGRAVLADVREQLARWMAKVAEIDTKREA